MPRTRPPYSPEFRQQMVELVRAGRTPGELSREFEPTAQTILNWVSRTGSEDQKSPRRQPPGLWTSPDLRRAQGEWRARG